MCFYYTAHRHRHSTSSVFLWYLKPSRLVKWRSWLKWLWTEEWIELNFCKLRMCLNLSMAYSSRRNGRCEFSHLLFTLRPISCVFSFPMSFIAARYERSLSVTITRGWLHRFMIFLKNFNTALRSRSLATKASRAYRIWPDSGFPTPWICDSLSIRHI